MNDKNLDLLVTILEVAGPVLAFAAMVNYVPSSLFGAGIGIMVIAILLYEFTGASLHAYKRTIDKNSKYWVRPTSYSASFMDPFYVYLLLFFHHLFANVAQTPSPAEAHRNNLFFWGIFVVGGLCFLRFSLPNKWFGTLQVRKYLREHPEAKSKQKFRSI